MRLFHIRRLRNLAARVACVNSLTVREMLQLTTTALNFELFNRKLLLPKALFVSNPHSCLHLQGRTSCLHMMIRS